MNKIPNVEFIPRIKVLKKNRRKFALNILFFSNQTKIETDCVKIEKKRRKINGKVRERKLETQVERKGANVT